MTEPFVGEIRMVGFDWAPRGWALCDGRMLPISQNSTLFSLLGTNFGGDGVATFGLPDLRGRAPIHQGQGPGLSRRVLGQRGGHEAVAQITEKDQPYANVPPFLCVNFIIALDGEYPQRP